MHIGFDGQSLSVGARHGFSTYLGSLLEGLRRRSRDISCVCWEAKGRATWRLPHQVWWDQVSIPWRAQRDQVGLIHVPAFSAAVVRPCPLVFTVMDLMFTRYPEWLPSRRARWYWSRWIPYTARRASAVIAPSEATRHDLITLARVPPERITVIPLALDSLFERRPSAEAVDRYRRQRSLQARYVLYVGSLDRRKDLSGLLGAFAVVRDRFPDLRLVLTGHLIRGRVNLETELARAKIADRVIVTGVVPDEELPLLYAGASLFVYPSLYEGFGLPPLEAMAMGTPVVTYRAASLPEVVGEAGLLVDPPFGQEPLAEAMRRVLADQALREELVSRGSTQAGRFTGQQMVERTVAMYAECLTARTGGPARA